jgi:transcriptional regulator with XRE-family HTH domain
MASEMADLERGERIRELREARRLTQQAVWERMCVEGGSKPDGRPFISLRMYQRYEEGRGISWEKLRVLAHVLDAGEDFILRGEGDRRQPRPARQLDTDLAERLAAIEEQMAAPAAVNRVEGELEARIARMEDKLDALHEQRLEEAALLARQTELLERIEKAVNREDEIRLLLGETATRLDEAAREAAQMLAEAPADVPPAPRARRKTAK